MTQKQYITIDVIRNDHTFLFNLPVGSTLGSAMDACFDFMSGLHSVFESSMQAVVDKVDPIDDSKKVVTFEVIKNNHKFTLNIPVSATLALVIDVCIEIANKIHALFGQVITNATDNKTNFLSAPKKDVITNGLDTGDKVDQK